MELTNSLTRDLEGRGVQVKRPPLIGLTLTQPEQRSIPENWLNEVENGGPRSARQGTANSSNQIQK